MRHPPRLAGSLLGAVLLLGACASSSAPTVPPASTAVDPAASSTVDPASNAVDPAASTPVAPAASAAASAAATPASPGTACTAPATPTTAQTEGPYYKAGAPASANLVTDGMAGTRITLTGLVLSTDCAPLANAKVEIWQADSSGTYDNNGYTLRGYVLTDTSGRYTIRTIVPGEYPGRTEHIHVKVTPEGGTTVTTQLYFPGTAANDSDGIYSPEMLLGIAQDGNALIGTFTFVVAA